MRNQGQTTEAKAPPVRSNPAVRAGNPDDQRTGFQNRMYLFTSLTFFASAAWTRAKNPSGPFAVSLSKRCMELRESIMLHTVQPT